MALFKERNKSESNASNASYLLDERMIEKVEKRKEKKPKTRTKITDMIPIQDITGNGYFQLKSDNGYFEILQISSKDVFLSDENGRIEDVEDLSYMYQAYNYDFKIISMNFPVNMESQKEYYLSLIKKCKVPSYLPLLEEKYREFEMLEDSRTNREYYLLVYANSEFDLQERVRRITGLLQRNNPVTHLSEDKKVKIINKLYNMNTKIQKY